MTGVAPERLSTVEQIEGYHDAAALLVGAQSVVEVLDHIVVQAGAALRAPGMVLAVRTDGPHGDLRIHSQGVAPEVATAIAATCVDEPPASSIVAPIVDAATAIGHLVAVLPPGTAADAAAVRILNSFARYCASALDMVNQLERARAARDTATALLGLSRRLARTTSASEVCDVLTASLPELIGCRDVSIELREDVPVTDREPRVVGPEDVAGYSRSEVDAAGITHRAVLPLRSGGTLLGVATATFAGHPGLAPEAIVERASAVADQAAIALDNARLAERLRHEALHDELTGLPRRVLAEDRCTHALAQRARTGEGVALLFLDLDGFKAVNDTHGHQVGDALLRGVAGRLRGLLRATDTCARLGGDEFIVLLGGLDGPEGAIRVATRIGDAFLVPFTVDVGCPPISVAITTSVGVAWANDDSDFDELLRRSDAAMYVAKRGGRNAYALADGPPPASRAARIAPAVASRAPSDA